MAPHPLTREGTVETTFTCESCGEEWRNPISSALCCDPAAPGPADDDHQTRRYELGYD